MKKNYIPLTENKTAFHDSSNFIHMKLVLIHIHIGNLLYHNTDAPPRKTFPYFVYILHFTFIVIYLYLFDILTRFLSSSFQNVK